MCTLVWQMQPQVTLIDGSLEVPVSFSIWLCENISWFTRWAVCDVQYHGALLPCACAEVLEKCVVLTQVHPLCFVNLDTLSCIATYVDRLCTTCACGGFKDRILEQSNTWWVWSSYCIVSWLLLWLTIYTRASCPAGCQGVPACDANATWIPALQITHSFGIHLLAFSLYVMPC